MLSGLCEGRASGEYAVRVAVTKDTNELNSSPKRKDWISGGKEGDVEGEVEEEEEEEKEEEEGGVEDLGVG